MSGDQNECRVLLLVCVQEGQLVIVFVTNSASRDHHLCSSLQVQLCPPPVSPLGIVSASSNGHKSSSLFQRVNLSAQVAILRQKISTASCMRGASNQSLLLQTSQWYSHDLCLHPFDKTTKTRHHAEMPNSARSFDTSATSNVSWSRKIKRKAYVFKSALA